MNNANHNKTKLLVNILPLFIILIASVTNAIVLEINSHSENEVVADNNFDFQLPDIETEIYDSKKEAYDNEFGIDSSKMNTQINIDGLFDEEKSDQELINKILAGDNIDNEIYSSNQNPSNYNTPSSSPPQNNYEKKEVIEVVKEPVNLFNQNANEALNSNLISKNLKCFIYGDQVVKEGQIVKMRLAEELIIGNRSIKQNSLIYGLANFKENRLYVHIQNLLLDNNQSMDVSLTLYDEYMIKGVEFIGYDDYVNDIGDEATQDALEDVPGSKYLDGASGIFKKKKKNPEVFLLDGLTIFLKAN